MHSLSCFVGLVGVFCSLSLCCIDRVSSCMLLVYRGKSSFFSSFFFNNICFVFTDQKKKKKKKKGNSYKKYSYLMPLSITLKNLEFEIVKGF